MQIYDVWADFYELPSLKGLSVLYLPQSWWQPIKISKGGQHANIRSENGKVIGQ